MGMSNDMFNTARIPDDLPVCPYHWAEPIHNSLNCPKTASDVGVWPKHLAFPKSDHHFYAEGSHNEGEDEVDELGRRQRPRTPPRNPQDPYVELDTPEYTGAIQKAKIVEKMLAMAGVRLAAVLNSVLDPQGAEGLKVQWNA